MDKYDLLIIGSGLFGSVFAYEANKIGKKVLIIEKRNHCGGNVYCENISGINVHKYGAHIFHTNDKNIWDYVNQFVEFNRFTNSPLASYKGKLYNLPFNMNTFYQMWGVQTPSEAQNIITNQIKNCKIQNPQNLEEQAISLVGYDIYNAFIKGYTEKQWGKSARELPSFIIKRIPVRFNFDNNYFNDKYQGIPIGGYNQIIKNLLSGIEIKLNVDFFSDRDYWTSIANKIIYTGPIDKFYDYKFGKLEYRSLNFEHKLLNVKNFQGNAVVNYTDFEIPYTRIIEHKHFEFGDQDNTIITYEHPLGYSSTTEPYYPINDDINNKKFIQYKNLMDSEKSIIFGGRLAEYKYYDMHQIIASALKKFKNYQI